MSLVPWFLALFGLSTGYALWRGGGPERVTAAVFVAGVLASVTVGLFRIPGDFATVPIRLLTIDVLGAILFAWIAIRANRLWTIPFAACQLLTALAHFARLADPGIIPKGYMFLTVIWSWPMVLLLAWGTYLYRERKRIGRPLPDWKPS